MKADFLVRCVLVSTVALLLAPVGRVGATNDETHIAEIMAGANGNSKIQFIVVRQEGGGQFWGPQFSETQSRSMLVFFDATGRETGQFKFPSDAPGPAAADVLIATQTFANLPGAPTPNFTIPPLLNPISGQVCFQSNPLNNVFPRKDCVSYGSFTGATGGNSRNSAGPGPPAAVLPIVNTVSLRSNLEFGNDLNSDFVITTTPTPRNNTGPPFTIPVATQIAQGNALFNNEPFLGNGRTCGACHVASQSFRLPPSDIQSRFSTVSSTFDPLFIAETAPSSFDAGFDFDLNSLVVTGVDPSSTNAPCTGELRGIITTTNGGKAKVLTRVSATTYLVFGGFNPLMNGLVATDGVCSATVTTVTRGSLGAVSGSPVAGVEDPKRMMTSLDTTDFPQGRGLILENIDGFTNPAVFRKSPHLLNLSRTAPFGFSGNIPDLQTFATGAVIQHFPRTLARNSGGANPDFRLPTADERAAMEAFMLVQEFPEGNDPNKFDLDRFAITAAQVRGRTAFFGPAKCSQCHGGPVLAQTTVSILGKGINVNASFNTGVVNQPINAPSVDNLPCEPSVASVGTCGSREFSVPQLFNVKNLGPFFHDGSVATVRQAVEFYNSGAFNNSPAGQAIGGITILPQTIDDLVAFLDGLTPRPRDRDFNGDGKADILWRHTSGAVFLWLMDGPVASSTASLGTVGTDWTVAAVGDFNGDGKADILWRHTSGVVFLWLMNGTIASSTASLGTVGTDWTIAALGDFNGDGKADILWRHISGAVFLWLMDGPVASSTASLGTVGTDWTIVNVADFNGDGKADILWRHTSGGVFMWLMNGPSASSTASLGTVAVDWVVQEVARGIGRGPTP
jgi:hypothetical protein